MSFWRDPFLSWNQVLSFCNTRKRHSVKYLHPCIVECRYKTGCQLHKREMEIGGLTLDTLRIVFQKSTGGNPMLCTVFHSLYKLDAVASRTSYWTQDCHNWDNKKLKVYRLWLKVFVCWGKFEALYIELKYESVGGKTRSRLCTGVQKCLSNSTSGDKYGFHFLALIHSIPAKKNWFTQCWNLLRMEKWKEFPSKVYVNRVLRSVSRSKLKN